LEVREIALQGPTRYPHIELQLPPKVTARLRIGRDSQDPQGVTRHPDAPSFLTSDSRSIDAKLNDN